MAVWTLIDSPAGGVGIAATTQGVCRISVGVAARRFAAELRREFPGRTWRREPADPALAEALHQVREYFAGERREFDLPAVQEGTPFQRAVWFAVRRIPWGQTASYSDVAALVGRPLASRAVGNAMNLCRLGLVVPCHRVVAAGGKAGGWGGDDRVKLWLLRFEGAAITSGPEPAARRAREGATERTAAPSRNTSRRR